MALDGNNAGVPTPNPSRGRQRQATVSLIVCQNTIDVIINENIQKHMKWYDTWDAKLVHCNVQRSTKEEIAKGKLHMRVTSRTMPESCGRYGEIYSAGVSRSHLEKVRCQNTWLCDKKKQKVSEEIGNTSLCPHLQRSEQV